ncbi:MAG: DUF5667 domain-containing protein [Candidatus Pacearchaeota archaeon]
MKKFIFLLFIFAILIGQINFVEAGKGIKARGSIPTLRILEVEEPKILPLSPLYFLKDWGRGIRQFLTFDSAKKAELELKYADEKLVETAKVVDENCGESSVCNVRALEKAFNNYLSSQERLKKKLESLSEKNQNVSELISETTEKVILHQALFDELVFLAKTRHDSVKSSIRNIKRVGSSGDEFEQVIKNFEEKLKKNKIDVIEGIGKLRMNKAELIDAIAKGNIKATEKLPYAEGVKELKALEILNRIDEKLPEEAEKGIETAKENIEKKLFETGEIKKAKNWRIEQGSSGWVLIEGVPIRTQSFDVVVGELEEKTKNTSSFNIKLDIVDVEAIKEFKSRLKEVTSSSTSREQQSGSLSWKGSNRLGLCDRFGNSATDNLTLDIQDAKALGFMWGRPLGDIFAQETVEKAGTFDFSVPDRFVKEMKSEGMEIFGTLFPTGIPMIPNSIDTNSFAKYVKAIVEHYKGQVTYWQVGIEPFCQTPSETCYKNFFDLTKTAYIAAKSVDPSVKISPGGPAPIYDMNNKIDPMAEAIFGYFFRNGGANYTDFFNFHYLVGKEEPDISKYVEYWKQYVSGKEIWLSETGSRDVGDRFTISSDENKEAEWVKKHIEDSFQNGISKVFWCRAEHSYSDMPRVVQALQEISKKYGGTPSGSVSKRQNSTKISSDQQQNPRQQFQKPFSQQQPSQPKSQNFHRG